jgi:hypothetical protein
MSRSKKPAVLEHLFRKRWNEASGEISSPQVTLAEVAQAIREVGEGLSDKNPANFVKDIVRSPNRNEHVPAVVVERGYTIKQLIGGDQCFEFVPLPPGQTQAFPTLEPSSDAIEDVMTLQSLTLPLAARRLANRKDESWLTQVVASLNVIQTHFARRSGSSLISLELLLTNVKLGGAEVDAVFSGTEEDEQGQRDVLLAVEMKHKTEVLELEQVQRGAAALGRSSAKMLGQDTPVIPMAAKVWDDNLVWVVEFARDRKPLEIESQSLFKFHPAVPGI